MAESLALAIYSKLPIWMQHAACSLAGFKMRAQRYNHIFNESLEFLKDSEWWNRERLEQYQNEQIQHIVSFAFQSVPYYRRLAEELGLDPLEIKSSAGLDRLPILDKNTLRESWDDLQSNAVSSANRTYGYTGGTTGTSLKIAYDKHTQPWQWAVWWRHRNRFGINIDDDFIVFAGRDVVPLSRMEPPIWRRNLPMKQTYVSIHHLSRDNLPILRDYLCRRKVKYYSGYPSALYIVATYFIDTGTKLPFPPKMTFTGAETLLPHQRRAIELAFSTTVSDQYGASEHCGNISECEYFNYHVDMEFGVVEFLKIEGMPDNVRRIVCTGLRNHAMPLIRYETGDIVTLSDQKCPCGRQSQVVEKIDGRIESYILTPDGRQLGRLDFLFKKTSNIEEAQLIQNVINRVTFRIVKKAGYSKQDEQKLIENIRSYMGDSFEIDIEYVPIIPRERNGKFRQIVSSVFKDRCFKQDSQ